MNKANPTREQIVSRAKAQLAEINQYFTDVEHWNTGRGIVEGVIDPDPDGSMLRCKSALEAMLANEERLKREGRIS